MLMFVSSWNLLGRTSVMLTSELSAPSDRGFLVVW